MTQEDIIAMAREAGGVDITCSGWTSWVGTQSTEFLERFVTLVEAAATEAANARATSSWTLMCKKMVDFEREACAKLVDAIEARCIAEDVDAHVAAIIRARGQA